MANNDFNFTVRRSGVTLNSPQPDPNASLGGRRSSTEVANGAVGTLTSVTNGVTLVDNAFPVDVSGDDSWMVMHDRTGNINAVRRVINYDNGTGTFTLKTPFDVLPQAGDRFRVYVPNGLFAAFTPEQASDRATRHRLVHYGNLSAQIIPPYVYVNPIDPGPLRLEIASGTRSTQFDDINIPFLADENDEPDTITSAGGLIPASGSGAVGQEFRDPLTNDFNSPAWGGNPATRQLSNATTAMWLRLVFNDDVAPRPHRSIFQVLGNASNTGTNLGSFLVIVDVSAPPLTFTLGPDRKPRVGGGARVQALVVDSLTNESAPNYTANIELEPPSPGSLGLQNKEETTADGEPLERVYTSPSDPNEAGSNVEFKVKVF